MSVTSPGCYLYFWPTGYKSEIPKSPLLGSINLLKWLTEIRTPIYSPDCWFITKGCNSETVRWKRHFEQWVGKGRGASAFSPSVPLSPNRQVFTNPEALQTLFLGSFVEGSLRRHNWLSHWPLAAECDLQPLFPPQRLGVGWRGLKVPIL